MRLSLPAQVLSSGYDLPTHYQHGRRTHTWASCAPIVAVLAAIWLTTYAYFDHVSARDPTSYFFDRTRAYKQKYSSHRAAQADAFIAKTQPDVDGTKNVKIPPRMCIGIATVSRRGTQFVSSTVGSLLEGLSNHERESIFVNILIAHSDPDKHPNAKDTWMQKLPDRILQYNREDPDFDRIVSWEEGGWYRNKTIFDYTYLLRDCYNTGAEFVAMIEDDTLAARGWYSEALDALETVKAKMKTRPEIRWAYLRLFYVEDLLGWNSEQWLTYLFWSAAVWACVLASMLYAKQRSVRYLENFSRNSILLTSITATAAYIGLYFMAGRQTVQPIAAGIQEMNKYGCCSQALVFPRAIVPLVLVRSDLTTDWLVDMMIEQISNKEHLDRWATVPALFQHVGTTSSKGYGFDDNARELWNFRFEDRRIP